MISEGSWHRGGRARSSKRVRTRPLCFKKCSLLSKDTSRASSLTLFQKKKNGENSLSLPLEKNERTAHQHTHNARPRDRLGLRAPRGLGGGPGRDRALAGEMSYLFLVLFFLVLPPARPPLSRSFLPSPSPPPLPLPPPPPPPPSLSLPRHCRARPQPLPSPAPSAPRTAPGTARRCRPASAAATRAG